jgi:pimeloyl-ACP methyl ester carboxylesterase
MYPSLAHDRTGSGVPVVLVHGIGHRRQAWDPVVERLAIDHDVIAVDLTGFGDSPGHPRGSRHDVASFADHLVACFATWGVERPHLAGNSLGGAVALELARRGAISSAVAVAPASFIDWKGAGAALPLVAMRLGAFALPAPVLRRATRLSAVRQLVGWPLYAYAGRHTAASTYDDALAMKRARGFELTAIKCLTPVFRPFRGSLQAPVTIAWGVGWAERGGYDAMGHGNSVPRFHVTWGTGPGIVEPFERRAREAQASGRLTLPVPPPRRCADHHQRHRRRRQRRDPRADQRRARQEQFAQGHRRFRAARAGGDRRLRRHRRQSRLVRQNWPKRLGEAAEEHDLRRARACRRPHDRHHRGRRRAADQPRPDVALRRGHPELVPIWPRHGIRILPGPSSMWFDATGKRLPAPLFPGSDTLGQLHYIMSHRLRLFVVRADPEASSRRSSRCRAPSRIPTSPARAGCMTARAPPTRARRRRWKRSRATAPTSSCATTSPISSRDERAQRRQSAQARIHQRQIEARDREIDNPYVKDAQVMNIHNARRYIGDRLIRTAKPHRILDPAHGR